ncbi:MAG: hypothetical protein MMC23_007577 [Stictis urceolatum]|nr:hypothetical protein [Stictis urceolata]
MVVVIPAPVPLDLDLLQLYHTSDAAMGNLPVIIFHGPSTTNNSTQNSSRIQVHICSVAGFMSFPRLTVSPTSPLYAAVQHLPEEQQGDEVCRGLAVSLMKHFEEIPSMVKKCLREMAAASPPDKRTPPMFDERHAAMLAAEMMPVENRYEIASHVFAALADKNLSWIDADVILPSGSMQRVVPAVPLEDNEDKMDCVDGHPQMVDLGKYKEIVEILGSPSFMPTSKMRRAPSKPNAAKRSKIIDQAQIESLQQVMWETLESEKNYISKLQGLTNSTVMELCKNNTNTPSSSASHSEKPMQQLFPPSLSAILDINTDFLNALKALMGDFEEGETQACPSELPWVTERDSTGADSFARVMLKYIPRFKVHYQEYIGASAGFYKILNDLLRESTSTFATAVQKTGERRLKQWLMDPTQRLPRYTLFIDRMVKKLPAAHSAVAKLLKARDMLSDICSLDDDCHAENSVARKRLRHLFVDWPEGLLPAGRLITAVDMVELYAPYRVARDGNRGTPCMLLLFPDYILVAKKLSRESLPARDLLAEVHRPAGAPSTIPQQRRDNTQDENLALTIAASLNETLALESHSGHVISLNNVHGAFRLRPNPKDSNNFKTITRSYCLLGAYEGKAAKLSEEIARARIEHRCPEKVRETDSWSLRLINPKPDTLGIVTALFEDDSRISEELQRRHHSRAQVLIGKTENEIQALAAKAHSEIIAHIVILGDSLFRLEFKGLQGYHSTDIVNAEDFEAVFMKRLSILQRLHNQPITAELALINISYIQKVLESIRPRFALQTSEPPSEFQAPEPRSRFRGATSPVKALSSFLGDALREPTNKSGIRQFY